MTTGTSGERYRITFYELLADPYGLGFHEDEVDGGDEAEGCGGMVPVELLVLEDEVGNDGEDHQRDALLDNLELHEVEGTSVVDEPDTVGRYLTAVFEEGNHPRKSDDQIEGPVGGDAGLLEAQMAIPGEGHKHIAHDEQHNRINSISHTSTL